MNENFSKVLYSNKIRLQTLIVVNLIFILIISIVFIIDIKTVIFWEKGVCKIIESTYLRPGRRGDVFSITASCPKRLSNQSVTVHELGHKTDYIGKEVSFYWYEKNSAVRSVFATSAISGLIAISILLFFSVLFLYITFLRLRSSSIVLKSRI